MSAARVEDFDGPRKAAAALRLLCEGESVEVELGEEASDVRREQVAAGQLAQQLIALYEQVT